MSLRASILICCLFVLGVLLAHTDHRAAAVFAIAGACLAVLVAKRGEW